MCPPPQMHLSEGELEAAVGSALRGDVELSAVDRERDDSQVERMDEGYKRQVPIAIINRMSHKPLSKRC